MIEEDGLKYQTISIDQIVDPGLSMRSNIDQENVEELAKSIKQVGLIEPIVVKSINGKFEIIAGHRRLLACRVAGVFFVPCRVVDASPVMIETLKIHENLYREDVNVVDEAHFIEDAMKKLKISIDGMSDLIGKSRKYVQTRLALLSFPDYLYNAVKEGRISFSAATRLSQIDHEPTLKQYVEYASVNGITDEVAGDWVRRWKLEKLSTPGVPAQSIETQAEVRDIPIMKVVCGLCSQELALRDAKTFYCHFDCYRKVSQT